MPLKTYFDFAEDDYLFLQNAYERGDVANVMGAIAQNICERYMKHLVEKFDIPNDPVEKDEKEEILRTHNLIRLMKHIQNNLGVSFSDDASKQMRNINGYYISARYPGDNVINKLTKDAIEDCVAAVEICRKETLELIEKLEKKPSLAETLDAAEQKAGTVQSEAPAKENER